MATKIFRALVLAGSFSAVSAGMTAGINYLLNHDQTDIFSNGMVQYRKMDDAYAHTVVTRGDPVYGKSSVVLERRTLHESKTYISREGSSLVDAIMIKPGIFGAGEKAEYRRSSDGRLKKELFDKAEAELLEQYQRFKPLIEKHYLP